ncbi:TPA: chromate efflux transporter [Aeromonas salmonicida]|uniref:Chromate transport protein ChrA n=11 Tax=Gammaproteobacteria TaxID=1236 RepID=A4SRM0_AERS4|nr:chromate efflux transporter [Aeromonas salmonicida]ABO91542.1 chromate transport protein ChrA [Aeromonas salmonicida subsp. salmonicida A449]AYO64543.1 chorismate-binding protein [Aeromonas salmonicida subsp. salmonicida 01-B526]EHI51193.1 chromate transport protein ChrA [Aeromonas salmonicida subsp. salmonicida 01-B526]EKP0253524.1 chromate efflux transporter [Aeromonas salmonicida]EKP0266236.1 chromate efflux transporter [Aeromonas salmonicida]
MGQVFIQFLWLGCVSFGGPAAHIGYFQRTFVERLGWLSQAEFAQLLALCQLLPGPASSQLGFAIGRHRAGLTGALAAFVGFTLPSFLLLLAAAIGLGQLTANVWLEAALHGLKLLALVVVADAVLTMIRQFCKTQLQQGVMVATAAVLWWQPGLLTQLGLLLGAALLCARFSAQQPATPISSQPHPPVAHPPHWPALILFALLFIGLPLLAHGSVSSLVADFYQAGSLVFGGGHVVLPLLQESVGHTLTQQQFLTGYSLAQLVPGPMFTLASYLGAQLLPATPLLGALLATLALFLPGFLLLWALGPSWQSWLARPRLAGAVTGINAAVVGLLLAALYQPVWLGAVQAPSDLALAAIGFYLLRVLKLPILALAGLLVGAAMLLA